MFFYVRGLEWTPSNCEALGTGTAGVYSWVSVISDGIPSVARPLDALLGFGCQQ